jgi:two-component system, NtrC family, sensor histidine kinase HydH
MADPEERSFRRTLTIVLSLLGVLTAGSVLLFGHLLFKTLSKDVTDDAIFHSRLDAQRIAQGVAERSAGDPYTLKYKQKELDRFIGTALAERQVLNEIRVLDKDGRVVYTYASALSRPEPAEPSRDPEGRRLSVSPGGALAPNERIRTDEITISDPYAIEIPIGNLFVLRAGISRKELEARVEKLRRELYLRTFAAAIVSLLGIGAASSAVILMFRRTRKVEAAHVEAERRAELGEVAAGLAHEIRNPLNAMGLNLELLEEQLQRGSARTGTGTNGAAPHTLPAGVHAVELAQAARQETTRLARMLTDFLAYARPSPVTPVRADLNVPASDAVAFLIPEADQRKIRLTFDPHPGGAPARLDESRVKQVVLNLVGNALDAVENQAAPEREVRVKIDEEGSLWRLTVTDRGPGVPAAKAHDIFTAFVSTKPAGTGLGLPIAERIVKAHGGTLRLVSEPGQPTRAVATFPKA